MADLKLFDLSGKTALVTGSSAGLGLVMALGLVNWQIIYVDGGLLAGI